MTEGVHYTAWPHQSCVTEGVHYTAWPHQSDVTEGVHYTAWPHQSHVTEGVHSTEHLHIYHMSMFVGSEGVWGCRGGGSAAGLCLAGQAVNTGPHLLYRFTPSPPALYGPDHSSLRVIIASSSSRHQLEHYVTLMLIHCDSPVVHPSLVTCCMRKGAQLPCLSMQLTLFVLLSPDTTLRASAYALTFFLHTLHRMHVSRFSQHFQSCTLV